MYIAWNHWKLFFFFLILFDFSDACPSFCYLDRVPNRAVLPFFVGRCLRRHSQIGVISPIPFLFIVATWISPFFCSIGHCVLLVTVFFGVSFINANIVLFAFLYDMIVDIFFCRYWWGFCHHALTYRHWDAWYGMLKDRFLWAKVMPILFPRREPTLAFICLSIVVAWESIFFVPVAFAYRFSSGCFAMSFRNTNTFLIFMHILRAFCSWAFALMLFLQWGA